MGQESVLRSFSVSGCGRHASSLDDDDCVAAATAVADGPAALDELAEAAGWVALTEASRGGACQDGWKGANSLSSKSLASASATIGVPFATGVATAEDGALVVARGGV